MTISATARALVADFDQANSNPHDFRLFYRDWIKAAAEILRQIASCDSLDLVSIDSSQAFRAVEQMSAGLAEGQYEGDV